MSVGALLLKLEVANVHKPGERAGFWMPQVDISAALIPAIIFQNSYRPTRLRTLPALAKLRYK